ncbi:hypothetical protein OF83DRAFT_1089809, partial [Amylostereum chailletii]
MSRLPSPESPVVPDLPRESLSDGDVKRAPPSEEDVRGGKGALAVVDAIPVVVPVRDDEPVVTRRELWSYYRSSSFIYLTAEPRTAVYYNGDNSLATAAGYDPVRGPGSSCQDAGASGRCVVPWSGGTKSVSSVVLVANGVSFA